MFEGNSGPIRPQDFRVIYRTLALTPQGISALIEFLTNKLDKIVDEIINGEKVAKAIYSILASRVAKDDEISKVCMDEKCLIQLVDLLLFFLKIDQLRNNLLVPNRLRKSFNSSFIMVEENLAWFKNNHNKISKWTKNYVDEHGLDVKPITDFSTTPVIPTGKPSDSERSSGVFLNTQTIMCITQIVWPALLLNALI